MRKTIGSFLLVLGAGLLSLLVVPDSGNASESPWSKFSFQLGGITSSSNSSVRFGSGAGVDVNLEDALGLDVGTYGLRFDADWRFTKNQRHKVDVSWHAIRRSGDRTLANDFTIEDPDDPDGPPIVIEAGARLESFLDIDIYKVGYGYSLFQDDRIDLALKFGLFIMPISTGFTATGLVNEKADGDFTAPLPVLGFQFDFAITPKWFFRTGSQVFYLEYENFKGALFQGTTAFEYKPWKHVGFGLGVEAFRLGVEAKGENYPGIDFKGRIDMNFLSALLYVKAYF